MRKLPHKFTLETLSSYLKKEGCELLSKEYKGTRSCIEYKARCGHICKMWVNNFLSGSGRYCRKCKKRKLPRELNIDTVKTIFEDNGCHLISSEYKDTTTPLKYVCQCGHINYLPLYRFDRGQGRVCPSCSGSKKKSIEEVRAIFKREGCKLLSPTYKWNRQKVTYVARCGHLHKIKASAFFDGEGRLCPICQRKSNADNSLKYTEKEQREIISKEGCILISPARTTNEKMIYRAQCGHIVEMRMEYFKKGYGHKCKKCYQLCISKGERAVKSILDELNIDYAPQYVIHTENGKRQRLDFYIPERKIAIEFNGRQHYEENEFFHGQHSSKKQYDFNYAKEQDERKRKWCKCNNVRLVEIDGRKWTSQLQSDEFRRYLSVKIGVERR